MQFPVAADAQRGEGEPKTGLMGGPFQNGDTTFDCKSLTECSWYVLRIKVWLGGRSRLVAPATCWFALAEGGVQCDEQGLFVGETPILRRSRRAGGNSWTVRPIDDLNRELGARYGLPIDAATKREGFAVVAKALERRDLALAQIAALLLQFPDPPSLAKAEGHDRAALAAELLRSGLLKGDWDPDKHPRTGTPPNPGWFAPKDDAAEPEPKGYDDSAVFTSYDAALRQIGNDGRVTIFVSPALPGAGVSPSNGATLAQFTVTPQGFGVQQLPGQNPLDPRGLNGPISAAEQQQIADALILIVNGNASALNPHTYNNFPSFARHRAASG